MVEARACVVVVETGSWLGGISGVQDRGLAVGMTPGDREAPMNRRSSQRDESEAFRSPIEAGGGPRRDGMRATGEGRGPSWRGVPWHVESVTQQVVHAHEAAGCMESVTR